MSEMTPYFLSLERSADLACAISETLQVHPDAIVRYKDEEVNDELIAALTDLESTIADPDSPTASKTEDQPTESARTESSQPGHF